VSPRTPRAGARGSRRGAVGAIPHTLLVVGGPFGDRRSTERALAAIAGGIRARGLSQPDILPLDARACADLDAALARARFDARLRRARALIVATERLSPDALRESATFEMATRARQAGVPAYAILGHGSLGAFEARMLDLQVVITASAPRALAAAGERLAELA
jgi:hypothetical protein